MAVKIVAQDAAHFLEKKVGYLRGIVEVVEKNVGSLLFDWRKFSKVTGIDFMDEQVRINNGETLKQGIFELEKLIAWNEESRKRTIADDPADVCHLGVPTSAREFMFGKGNDGITVVCRNVIFQVKGAYSSDEAKMLVSNKVKKMRGEVEYLKFRKDSAEVNVDYQRLPIPEDVRNEVWRRDNGRCVRCGSVRNLEFDHLIPVSKGGGRTSRNIQLLCESCNRAKSATI